MSVSKPAFGTFYHPGGVWVPLVLLRVVVTHCLLSWVHPEAGEQNPAYMRPGTEQRR